MNRAKLSTAILLALSSQTLYASGFALIEQSASGQGLSYAGAAANAEDASVMWFNPAGLTEIKGNQVVGALHIIAPSAQFTNNGSTGVVAPSTGGFLSGSGDDGATVGLVPNIFWKGQLNDYDVGLAMNVPFGQHISYDEEWVGRYAATETDLTTINLSASIARKLNDKVAFGFGFNAQYVDVILEQKVNQSAIGDVDGNAKVTGDSWAYGYNLGFTIKPTDTLDVGISYRSAMKHDVDGQVEYRDINSTADLGGGLTLNQVLFDAGASANVELPAIASLAINQRLNSKIQLLASSTWTEWGAYDELVVEFENGSPASESNQNFENSMRYALGVIYQYNDAWKLRSGIALDKTPVPNKESRSPRTPDSDRKWISVGAGYQLNKDMVIDVAYSHLMANKAASEYTTSSSLGDSVLSGSYDASVNILSAQLVWNY